MTMGSAAPRELGYESCDHGGKQLFVLLHLSWQRWHPVGPKGLRYGHLEDSRKHRLLLCEVQSDRQFRASYLPITVLQN